VQQLNLHTSHVPADEKRAGVESFGTFMTTFDIDIGDLRIVLFLPPGAGEHAMKAAEHLNAALKIAYPEKPTAEEADAELAKP
jgi:hypothetical protein